MSQCWPKWTTQFVTASTTTSVNALLRHSKSQCLFSVAPFHLLLLHYTTLRDTATLYNLVYSQILLTLLLQNTPHQHHNKKVQVAHHLKEKFSLFRSNPPQRTCIYVFPRDCFTNLSVFSLLPLPQPSPSFYCCELTIFLLLSIWWLHKHRFSGFKVWVIVLPDLLGLDLQIKLHQLYHRAISWVGALRGQKRS